MSVNISAMVHVHDGDKITAKQMRNLDNLPVTVLSFGGATSCAIFLHDPDTLGKLLQVLHLEHSRQIITALEAGPGPGDAAR